MAIGMAQQRDRLVYAYDEKGRVLWTRTGELQGWTSGNVAIKSGNLLYMYNEKGSVITTKTCY